MIYVPAAEVDIPRRACSIMAPSPPVEGQTSGSNPTSGTPKKQPWRTIYPCVLEALNADTSFTVQRPRGNIPKHWNNVERGILSTTQETALAKLIEQKFGGKVWYDRSDGDGEPDEEPCESCGNLPCTCSVFEGG